MTGSPGSEASVWSLVMDSQSTYGNSKLIWPTSEVIQPSYSVSKYAYWVVTQDFHGNYHLGPMGNEDAFGFAYSDFTVKSISIGGQGTVTLPINEVSALNAYTLPPDGAYLANLPANEGSYAKTVWGEIYWSHTVDIIPNWLTLIGGWTWDYSSATTVPNFSALPWRVSRADTFLHRVGAILSPGVGLLYASKPLHTDRVLAALKRRTAPTATGGRTTSWE